MLAARPVPSALRRAVAGWRTALPHGRTLPAGKFEKRHARLRRLLWLHAAALPLVSLAIDGAGFLHHLSHGVPLATLAVLSGLGRNPRLQATCVALGLLSASAMTVHAAHGATEAHFHFFLMMSLLSMYEDWLPYGIGVAYVFVHHAVLGAVAPMAVFGHGGDPVGLAAIHAGFIFGAAIVNVALWRTNERARAVTASAMRRVELQYDITRVLAAAVSLDDAVQPLLRLIGERLEFSVGILWTPEPDGARLRPTTTWVVDPALESTLSRYRATATLAPGEGVVGRAWQTGGPVSSDVLVVDTHEAHRDIIAESRQRGAIAIPIRAGEAITGVLAFTSERACRPAAETVELLASISRQLALFMDRVQRAEEARVFEDAAMTDALTGLPNRRAWDSALRDELAWAARHGKPVALAMIDLDRFKAYNDTRGHLAGDALLARAARSWRGVVRTQDVLARYGGEEFALAMPGCELADAEAIVERLRRHVPDGQTCSVGLTMWDPRESVRDLVHRADEALYAAKRGGRDRVAVAAPAHVA